MKNELNGKPSGQPTVIRTGRGLTVAGTRVTLYRIMDYVKANWPPKLIRDRLNLTEQQIADALAYIDEHQQEVEAEYQQVLAESEQMRKEWEEKRQDVRATAASAPPKPLKPEEVVIRAKLAAAKLRLGME